MSFIKYLILLKLCLPNEFFFVLIERSELICDKKLLSRNFRNQSIVSKNQGDVLADIYESDSSKKGYFLI